MEIFSLLNIKVPEAVSIEAPFVFKKSHPRRASCLESLTTYTFVLNVCDPRRNETGNEPKMSNCCPVSVCATWKLFSKGRCFSVGMRWCKASLMSDKPAPVSRKTLTLWSSTSPFMYGVQIAESEDVTMLSLWAADNWTEDWPSSPAVIRFTTAAARLSVHGVNAVVADLKSDVYNTAHPSVDLGSCLNCCHRSIDPCSWVEKSQSHHMQHIPAEG